eukprot:343507_1
MPSRMQNSMRLLLKHIGRLSMQGAHSLQRTTLGSLQEIIESIPNPLNLQLISHVILSLGVGFTDLEVEKLTAEAGRLAKVARDGMKGAEHVMVLGSLPPLLESYRPDKVFPFEEGRTWYTRIAEALNPYVDGFLAETLSSTEEMMQALAAARLLKKPFYGSFTVDEDGLLRSGESFDMAIQRVIDADDSGGSKQRVLRAILLNCSTPESIQKALEGLKLKGPETTNVIHEHGVLLGAYANRLTPVPEGWEFGASEDSQPLRIDIDPQSYAKTIMLWVKDLGVRLVGGCCGIGPEYIAEIRKCLKSEGLLTSDFTCNDEGGNKATD